ncbi:MAG: tRNA (adenosine(37)-N6)-threonylcarbamoyltransferase complex ATPase subunit type 1 TsaE [Proteobacteria bacterium]|nr:tRNA (adenosine(37)-N6)-threonylcarbamoyltransferase complex ATPase subunit type 1 TsaE [Pseudomonadota bacterium]
MTPSSHLWTKNCTELSLGEVVQAVMDAIKPEQHFCLWLQGDLGAGKTYFARALLKALGLGRDIPVLSPTFAVMTEYVLNEKKICHLDLYRLAEGDSDSLDGILSDVSAWGYLVEWPERVGSSPRIRPTHVLQISFETDGSRRYQFGGT